MWKLLPISFILSFVLLACHSEKTNFETEFKKYIHKINIDTVFYRNKTQDIYLLDISCTPCLESKIDYISQIPLNDTPIVILIGQNPEKKMMLKLKKTLQNSKIVNDKEANAYLYQLNFIKFIRVKLKNGKICKIENLDGI